LSHIVSVSTKIRDSVAVTAACQRLGLPQPIPGTAKLYSGEATGLLVQFPGWQYPAVIDTNTGAIQYDNLNGHWGETVQMDKFLQSYAVEATKLAARRKGLQVSEQTLQDGIPNVGSALKDDRARHQVYGSKKRGHGTVNISFAAPGAIYLFERSDNGVFGATGRYLGRWACEDDPEGKRPLHQAKSAHPIRSAVRRSRA
jgi:hypothetical protein